MKHEKFYILTEQVSKKLYEPVHDIKSLNQWKIQMINLIDEISQLKLSSSTIDLETNNTSLDPTDWFSARNIAHQTLDAAIQSIQSIRNQPVWHPIPNEIRSAIEDEPVPEQGQALSNVCEDVFSQLVPYTRGNTHPRFWGWAMGEGTLGGILADMFTATMNINAGGCTHSAVLVERTVIQWMREIFGFPKGDNGGLVVSGTSIATIICLATARRRYLTNVRSEGIVNGPHLIVYASTEVHMCVTKALELLGLGSKAMHLISVDENFSINIDELKKTIEIDRKNGLIPFCIVGTAGIIQ
jgi:glutamate/tyrosine decarboxylase-like PLP-dependent enzyme